MNSKNKNLTQSRKAAKPQRYNVFVSLYFYMK